MMKTVFKTQKGNNGKLYVKKKMLLNMILGLIIIIFKFLNIQLSNMGIKALYMQHLIIIIHFCMINEHNTL